MHYELNVTNHYEKWSHFFIVRLTVDDFKKERKNMKSNDQELWININSGRVSNFHDEELKESILKRRHDKIKNFTNHISR